jgi:hypothetical protein
VLDTGPYVHLDLQTATTGVSCEDLAQRQMVTSELKLLLPLPQLTYVLTPGRPDADDEVSRRDANRAAVVAPSGARKAEDQAAGRSEPPPGREATDVRDGALIMQA